MFDVAGVVLAGGKSLRMGQDKANLIWGGRSFLENILCSMEGVFSQRIVVGRDAPTSRIFGDVIFQSDVRKDCGPLGGIFTALLICKSPAALFGPCDSPKLDAKVYAQVCAHLDAEGRQILVSGTGPGSWGNFPMVIPKTYLPVLRRLLDAGERSVKSLLDNAMVRMVSLDSAEMERIRSVNTREEYEALA